MPPPAESHEVPRTRESGLSDAADACAACARWMELLVRRTTARRVDRIVVEAVAAMVASPPGRAAELRSTEALLDHWRSATTVERSDVDRIPAALPRSDLDPEERRARHDMNNHLAALATTHEVLELDLEEEERGHYAAVLEREYARAGELLANAITAERAREATDGERIVLVLRDVARSEESAFRAEGIAFETKVEAELGRAHYAVSETELGRIARNLLINAREACAAASTGSVRLTASPAEADRPGLVLTVDDDGPGIAPDVLARLFEDGVSTRRREDAGERQGGLGLGSVRQLVERAGGSVGAENRSRGGARFRVWLPSSASSRF